VTTIEKLEARLIGAAQAVGSTEVLLGGNIRLNLDIFGERLKALPIFLFNRDSDVTRLAGLNVVNCARFAGVRAADDFALVTVY